MTATGSMLALHHVTRRFGGLVAVNDLTMCVEANAIHGLIGPNGAGKSTAFDLISGLTTLSGGSIEFDGADLTRASVEQRVRAGICRTFQTPRLFEKMTALDVVMCGRHLHGRTGILGSMFSVMSKHRDEVNIRRASIELLDFVGLSDAKDDVVSNMPYGKRRLVEIARALATGPKMLLLDEVASGLNPVETAAVSALIRRLQEQGMTIVLVEHDMRFVMDLCGQITVLNFGTKIASGTPAEVSSNQHVIEAYLGHPRPEGRSRRDQRRAILASGTHSTDQMEHEQ